MLIGVALLGCKRGPTVSPPEPPPRLVEIKIAQQPPGDARLDESELTAQVGRVVAESGWFTVALDAAPTSERDFRLRIEVGVAREPSASGGTLRAAVVARLASIRGHRFAPMVHRALAERSVPSSEPAGGDAGIAAERSHAQRAIEDTVRSLLALARLHLGPRAAIEEGLRSSDDDLRDEAIRVAAERRDSGAVPALIALLKSDDLDARDRALGALVDIGDRRAVRPITEAAKFHDLPDLTKVIDALATLGGDEARSYLEFVATGHDDPTIRVAARDALARLDRRSVDAGR